MSSAKLQDKWDKMRQRIWSRGPRLALGKCTLMGIPTLGTGAVFYHHSEIHTQIGEGGWNLSAVALPQCPRVGAVVPAGVILSCVSCIRVMHSRPED